MSNTQNNQDIENKASLDKEDEAFVKFDEEQTEKIGRASCRERV